jgi:hypothetical protein
LALPQKTIQTSIISENFPERTIQYLASTSSKISYLFSKIRVGMFYELQNKENQIKFNSKPFKPSYAGENKITMNGEVFYQNKFNE